mmetsp:Transcript_65953/g.132828  ORF Transcript_65953/g.132828 Transcript_65953/m.132828 type:complete len:98 (-) Transcript_65953:61-354(-)
MSSSSDHNATASFEVIFRLRMFSVVQCKSVIVSRTDSSLTGNRHEQPYLLKMSRSLFASHSVGWITLGAFFAAIDNVSKFEKRTNSVVSKTLPSFVC